ncbi:N-acetylglucosamine-6-phosphate deacetylase [Pseudoalteromonas shioyasakiensis]|uniref:N-acetylglucosamine-6-phosphate deacetylase n=1 Tax=Pseudoalteromonas gelatinilytica TaxID=1703256 RepID=UPI0007B819CC|nr:N-acetylglucosamine-6-phosphate deacetylase [Pseudoalteromonas gelatinilytica]KZY45424.1 N-acetylglucosamine-6-phosphate deacetylase [Pseudoalteromonas shioyasakiensis]
MLIPTHLNRYYLKAAKVVTADAVLLDHVVLVEQGKITAITTQIAPEVEVIDLGEHSLFPGFIDLHIHGREGCDIMDGTPESLETISRSLAKHGVTGFVGTTVTADWDVSIQAYKNMASAYQKGLAGAQLLGAYNEGLFFAEAHKGAHNESFFLELTKQRFDEIYAACEGCLSSFALAPELLKSPDMIRYITDKGVRVMLGHTDANFEQTTQALAHGACGGVHIFNGMRGIHHRDPGCTGALLMDNDAMVELIPDGIHLHPSIMNMVYRLKGADKIALITDCVSAGGLQDGRYRLGELPIVVEQGVARTESGSLAGSTLTMEVGVERFYNLTDASLVEATNMASLVPAEFLNKAEQIGSIAVGKQANFALLDKDFSVQATICAGKQIF